MFSHHTSNYETLHTITSRKKVVFFKDKTFIAATFVRTASCQLYIFLHLRNQKSNREETSLRSVRTWCCIKKNLTFRR